MTWHFCSAFLSCSVVNTWWLAFMQLIRRKWLEKKPALRPAAIFGLCDERNTSLAIVPALHPSPAEGWREAGASRATVVFPPIPRACKSHRFSVMRNILVVEPLVLVSLPRGARSHIWVWEPWIPLVTHPRGLSTILQTQPSPHMALLGKQLPIPSPEVCLCCEVCTAGSSWLEAVSAGSLHLPDLTGDRRWSSTNLDKRRHLVLLLVKFRAICPGTLTLALSM